MLYLDIFAEECPGDSCGAVNPQDTHRRIPLVAKAMPLTRGDVGRIEYLERGHDIVDFDFANTFKQRDLFVAVVFVHRRAFADGVYAHACREFGIADGTFDDKRPSADSATSLDDPDLVDV